MKKIKKTLKITGIVIAAILVLLIVTPIAFQGKIGEMVKKEINESVNAEVDFDSFRISLIRNFPHVSLRINGLSVEGVDEFKGVKLADIGSIFVSVDVMSFIRGDTWEIRSIRIDNPDITVIVLEDGTANWDIMIPSEEIPEEEEEEEIEEDTEPAEFNLALRRFEIRNANIIYDDAPMSFFLDIKGFDHRLRGDFTADHATLSIPLTRAKSFTMRFEGIPLISSAVLDFTAEIDAVFSQQHFTFKQNKLAINDLLIGFNGWFAMPPGGDMEMDINFESKKTDINSFISLIPAIYAKDFESIQTSGNFGLDGYAKGIMKGEIVPSFALNILLEDGEFSYPDLPEAVTDIQLIANVVNQGNDVDMTEIDVAKFRFNMADNFADALFNLKTPISDPQFNFSLNCDINLDDIEKFYPLPEGESLTGKIIADILAGGKLSDIENERFERVKAQGKLELNGIEYKTADFDDIIELRQVSMDLSPQHFNLTTFDCQFGETHVLANGRVDNIFEYMFSDQLLSGAFDLRVNYLNINDFMVEPPEEPVEVEKPEETEPMELSIIEVPGNIDFSLNTRIDKLLFGNIEIDNIIGAVRVIDNQVRMDNLRMNLMDGSLTLNGSYGAKKYYNVADVDFSMAINRFDIQQTFNTFNTAQILAPVGKYCTGRFSAGMTMQSMLDEKLNPVLETLEGRGNLSTHSVVVDGPPPLQKTAERLKMEKLEKLEISDVNVSFSFKEGSIEFDPFEMEFGNSSAIVSGRTYFDQSIDYNIEFNIPREELGSTANEYMESLVSEVSAIGIDYELFENIIVNAKITGTFDEPEVSVDLSDRMKDAAGGIRDRVRDEVDDFVEDVEERVRDEVDRHKERAREEVEEVIDDTRERAREELERRADQVVSAAEREAERVRRESKRAADSVREEAREQAQRLIDEADGRIAKAAAERTGDRIIKEADERADRLEREGEERAQRIIDEAEKRAERIRAGEE